MIPHPHDPIVNNQTVKNNVAAMLGDAFWGWMWNVQVGGGGGRKKWDGDVVGGDWRWDV